MTRPPHVPSELTRGPFTRDEALRAGLTPRQLRGSSWRRVGRGLYVWAGLTQSPRLVLSAVQRRLPPGAAFSGLTAAWLHGLDVPPCDPIEVTLPGESRISTRAGLSVRRATLPAADVVQRHGLLVTSGLRTVVDLGGELPLVEAVVVVDMALHRRLVRTDQLRSFIAGHGRRKGVARLRRVVDLAEPAAESPMETRLRMLLGRAGLPRPQTQARLYDHQGRFVARTDLRAALHVCATRPNPSG